MEKFDDSSGDEESHFNELRILSSRFCRASTWGDLLSEKLNQLVEQRHSALGYNKLVCTSHSRLAMHSGNFRKNYFSDLATIKFNTSFHCKCFSGVESHLNAFGEQNLNTSDWVLFQVLQTNSFCSKNFKDNRVFLSFNKGILSNSSSFWWVVSLKSASLVLRDRL